MEKENTVATASIAGELTEAFPGISFPAQETVDEFPTIWVQREEILKVLDFLKNRASRPYRMMYDLTAIDERIRTVLPNFSAFRDLEQAVRRLSERVEALERRLGERDRDQQQMPPPPPGGAAPATPK